MWYASHKVWNPCKESSSQITQNDPRFVSRASDRSVSGAGFDMYLCGHLLAKPHLSSSFSPDCVVVFTNME